MRARFLALFVVASVGSVASMACDPTCVVGTDCPGPDQCDDRINACTSDNVAVNCGSNGPQRVPKRTPCASNQRCTRGSGANGNAFCADFPLTSCDAPGTATCTADKAGIANCVASDAGAVVATQSCSPGVCRQIETPTAHCQ
jgi:hypothetical protein